MNYDFTLMLKEQIEELKKIDKILKQTPHDKKALLRKGFLLLDGEDFENAVIAYEKVVELYPECVDAYLWLAKAYSFVCQFQKQKEVCQKGLLLDPNRADLHLYLAYALEDLDFIKPNSESEKEMDAHLYKAVELEPTWITPWLAVIDHLIEAKKAREAQEVAKTALENIKFTTECKSDESTHYEEYVTRRMMSDDGKRRLEHYLKNIMDGKAAPSSYY